MAVTLCVQAWSTTAASNNTADSGLPTIADTMSPTDLDDTLRGIMASVKAYANDVGGAITSAGTDTITIATGQGIESGQQAAGFSLRFKAGGTNTGAATLNVDSIGAVAIKRLNGDALSAGDIVSGGIYDVAYDGTNYKLLGAGTGSGTYGTLSGANTWSGANVFTSSVTVGDGSGDVVVIKGTTVHATMSALLSSSTVASFCSAIGMGTEDTPTFTAATLTGGALTLSGGGVNITSAGSVTMTNGFASFARDGLGNTASTVMRVTRSDTSGFSGQELIDFFGNGAQIGSITIYDAGGPDTADGVTYNTTSDGRRKPEIYRRPIEDSGAVIDALNPVRFKWDSGSDDFGFIAQEVHAVIPQAVKVGDGDPDKRPGDDGYEGWEMQYGRMEAIIVAEVQSLRRRVAELEISR